MVIGLDARAASEVPAGRGRVVRELLEALAALPDDHSYRLYCRTPGELELDERFRWERVESQDPVWHLRTALAASKACDVFLSTNSYLTAWFLRVPCALIVYDLIPFHPEAHPQRRARLIEQATIRPALRRAKSLICISDSTRRDLVEAFPHTEAKARVVSLAVSDSLRRQRSRAELDAVLDRHGLGTSFVLCTGTLEPRKNLVRLIDAYAELPLEQRAVYPLALVGPKGWEEDEIRKRIAEAEVRFLGYVSDDDLAGLYQSCTVFCYPSLYEGFGLPVLEAMTSGAPVLTSAVSSMPEIAGEAALYVDPLNVEDIRVGLARLLSSEDERRTLAERGRERAASFSWERTARETLEILENTRAGG